MEFKEIKPGMVIHCPKEEDARALLKHLDGLGYTWFPSGDLMKNTHYKVYESGTCYNIDLSGKTITYGDLYADGRPSCEKPPTEFSDLIEPDDSPMTAKEILEWFRKAETKDFEKLFSCDNIAEIFDYHTNDEIIRIITAYEAAPKPVEVEFGWYCEILKMGEWGVMETVDQREMWEGNESTAMDETAERAKQYAIENGIQTYYKIYGMCRVKEDEA